MKYSVTIRKPAEMEMQRAKLWYRGIRSGLEEDLMLCLEAAVEKMARTPLSCAARFMDIRKIRLQRFPYSLCFRVKGEEVVVIAFMHDKQDPIMWQHR